MATTTTEQADLGSHDINGVEAAKFSNNNVTAVVDALGIELGTHAKGFGMETSTYDRLNVPLQLLQYPLFNSFTSKLTLSEEGGDEAVRTERTAA